MKKTLLYICLFLLMSLLYNCGAASDSMDDGSIQGLTAITITPAATVVEVGQSIVLTATGTFDDGSTKDISSRTTWESSPEDLVSISEGIVLTKGIGQVMVYASANSSVSGYTITSNPATITITNIMGLVSIAITPNPISVEMTKGLQLTATATLADNSTRNITSIVSWSVADPGIASFSNNGYVSGSSVGTSTVTAWLGDFSTSVSISVTYIQVSFTLTNHYESDIVFEVWKGTQLSYDPLQGNVIGYATRACPLSSTPEQIANNASASVVFETAPDEMLLVIIGVPYQGRYIYIADKQIFSFNSPVVLTLNGSGILE